MLVVYRSILCLMCQKVCFQIHGLAKSKALHFLIFFIADLNVELRLSHRSGKYCIILQFRLFYNASSVSVMVNCVMAKFNPKICSVQLSNKPEIHELLNIIVGLIIMDYTNFTLQWLNTNILLQIRYFSLAPPPPSLLFRRYKIYSNNSVRLEGNR